MGSVGLKFKEPCARFSVGRFCALKALLMSVDCFVSILHNTPPYHSVDVRTF
jgi:hypothetical protein